MLGISFQQCIDALSVSLKSAQKPIHYDENNYHPEASASKFLCAVTSNQCFKKSVHWFVRFWLLLWLSVLVRVVFVNVLIFIIEFRVAFYLG